MEPRVAKLEATTEHIQRDVTELKTELKTEIRGLRSEARANFRLLLGANVSVAVGLGGLMAKGFGWY
ncbi:hypothetical protein CEY04_10210 [Achromobacter sp. HZ28]|nr:hypothetical protein CEY05_21770 [Achromobacter sp. HZ34]OWT79801.1 hypothetical protein CEY04_10210 [Achromobacter sp. HZ28]